MDNSNSNSNLFGSLYEEAAPPDAGADPSPTHVVDEDVDGVDFATFASGFAPSAPDLEGEAPTDDLTPALRAAAEQGASMVMQSPELADVLADDLASEPGVELPEHWADDSAFAVDDVLGLGPAPTTDPFSLENAPTGNPFALQDRGAGDAGLDLFEPQGAEALPDEGVEPEPVAPPLRSVASVIDDDLLPASSGRGAPSLPLPKLRGRGKLPKPLLVLLVVAAIGAVAFKVLGGGSAPAPSAGPPGAHPAAGGAAGGGGARDVTARTNLEQVLVAAQGTQAGSSTFPDAAALTAALPGQHLQAGPGTAAPGVIVVTGSADSTCLQTSTADGTTFAAALTAGGTHYQTAPAGRDLCAAGTAAMQAWPSSWDEALAAG